MRPEVSRHGPALHSLDYDDVGDVDTSEPQPNEIDKLVEPFRSPWKVQHDFQHADRYI